MPAKDLYHDTVKIALEKDGWTVTDSLPLKVGRRDLFIDLGAEKLLVAQQDNRKIAVEVKSFVGASPVTDLEQALGQYLLYEDLMRSQYPDRLLYLAIRDTVYESFFQEEIVQIVLESRRLKLLIFDDTQEVILAWIPEVP